MLQYGLYDKEISSSFNAAIDDISQSVKPLILVDWLDSRHVDKYSNTEIASSNNTCTQKSEATVNLNVTGMLSNGRSLSANENLFNRSRGRDFYFTPNESINGIERQAFTWGVCDAKDVNGKTITANGQWHCLPSTKEENYEFGYESATKSTGTLHSTLNGYELTSAVLLTYVFTERKVNLIKVVTSEYNGQIKAYNVKAYNNTSNLVYNQDAEIPEDNYFFEHYLDGIASNDINKIILTVYTTKNPYDYVRVNEMSPIYRLDMTDYVMNFNVSKVRDVHETSLPIAGSGSNTSSITFDNALKDFNLFNSASAFGKYMKKDIRFNIYAGWEIHRADGIYVDALLNANITSSSTTWNVNSVNDFPAGGVGNYYLLTIEPNTVNKEIVIATKGSGNTFTIIQRGVGGTTGRAHSSGSIVRFDIYEYVPYGSFYVDEWQGSSSSMTVSANLTDRSKFGQEKMLTKGFLLQDSTVAEAVEHLLLMTNFPKSDVQYLLNPAKTYKKNNAILHYGFDENSIDRANSQKVVSTSLRARLVQVPENDLNSVRDIKLDANDRELSTYEKALDVKAYITPSLTTTSAAISSSNALALDFVSGQFTDKDSAVVNEYFNGVFDGYYVPSATGTYSFVIGVNKGGFRVYLNKVRIIDEWRIIDSGTNAQEYIFSGEFDLTAGNPYELRIEFFTEQYVSGEPFQISLGREYNGTQDNIYASECYTMVASDRIGNKNDYSYLTFASNSWTQTAGVNLIERSARRNDAIYRGSVAISQPSGVVSDSANKSVLLASNSYLRTPYHISYDVFNTASNSYTGEFSIQIYAKFHSGSFSSDGEYISNWSNATSTAGFEFFNNSSSNGFKFKTSTGTQTVSSNTALSSSVFNHIAVTYKSNSVKYYINGALANTVTTTGTLAAFTGKSLTFGGRGAAFTSGSEVAPATIRSFYIDEFAVFNKCLSSQQITNDYIETQMKEARVMPFIYGNDASVQEIIDNISLADFGRLYIDENNKARYEHFNRFFESSIAQHANVQYTLSDSSNIIDASYNVQLQANKIVIKVNGVANNLIAKQSLWRAEDPTTLGVTRLSSSMSNNDLSMNVLSTDNPYFAKSGYLKIDNEVIKYSNTTSNSFLTLERAQFDTFAASHNSNTLVREVKSYDLLFDKAPAFKIENPLITNLSTVNPAMIELIKYNPTPYGAKLILAASNNTTNGDIVYVEGENPLTGEKHFAGIAGIPVIVTDRTGDVKEQKAVLDDNIRRYGLKEIVIENEFITDLAHAQSLADFIISKMSDPVPVLNLNILPIPKLQLGDRIRISTMDSFDIINGDYWLISTEFSYGQTLTQSIVIRKVV
jgi:hypothetical protein